ncbi:MAG: hypothetical protein NZ890_09665, partial [Myxococcota bacterium]|nr:hypothetical protein [Myxococcota bacterium]
MKTCAWWSTHLDACRAVRMALGAALLGLLSGCSPRSLREVPNGKESLYSFLSQGEARAALALLSDLWDLGPRFPPVRIRPLTWTEDPFSDSYWRFLFYSLRPTSNL